MHTHNHPIYIKTIKNTVVLPSSIHGFGLFSTETIPKGTLLTTLQGQVVPSKLYKKLIISNKFPKELFVEKTTLPSGDILAMPFRTSYGFINHCPKGRVSHIEEIYNPTLETIEVYVKIEIPKGIEILDIYNLSTHIDILQGFRGKANKEESKTL